MSTGPQRTLAPHADAPLTLVHDDARGAQLLEEELEMRGSRPTTVTSAAGRRPHDQVGAGFDAVGDDAVIDTVHGLSALHVDRAGAGALDDRPHATQEVAQVDDLRLSGRVLDDRLALGGGGRHEQVLGGADAGVVERHGGPAQLGAVHLMKPWSISMRGAELLEAADVEVDAPRPDVAAAGHGDDGFAEARDERAHDDDAGAHGAHQLVGAQPLQRAAGAHAQLVAVLGDVRPEGAQHRHHGGDVGDARHVPEHAGLVGEQARGQQLERRVLGTRQDDLALQPACRPGRAGARRVRSFRPSDGD